MIPTITLDSHQNLSILQELDIVQKLICFKVNNYTVLIFDYIVNHKLLQPREPNWLNQDIKFEFKEKIYNLI